MKKFVTILFSMIVFLCSTVSIAFAAESVQVILPSFAVSINGQVTEDTYSKYPFIVYKDITYIPMTYYDSRLLGLQTSWSAEDGLEISITEKALSEYKRELVAQKNKKRQTATIATGTIRVNGKMIDNQQEAYPLLIFRDVTYFPLTWRFAVNEFDWQYQFDAENGLCIESKNGKLKNTVVWDGIVESGGPVMGTGDLKFGVNFLPKQLSLSTAQVEEQLQQQSVLLYNFLSTDVTILPSEECWEYRIYQKIGKDEYLVYRKAIPFYTGDLQERSFAYSTISVPYWTATNISKGNYKIKLYHPEFLNYQEQDTTQKYLWKEGACEKFSVNM